MDHDRKQDLDTVPIADIGQYIKRRHEHSISLDDLFAFAAERGLHVTSGLSHKGGIVVSVAGIARESCCMQSALFIVLSEIETPLYEA